MHMQKKKMVVIIFFERLLSKKATKNVKLNVTIVMAKGLGFSVNRKSVCLSGVSIVLQNFFSKVQIIIFLFILFSS